LREEEIKMSDVSNEEQTETTGSGRSLDEAAAMGPLPGVGEAEAIAESGQDESAIPARAPLDDEADPGTTAGSVNLGHHGD
jgi:hypothetical protein